MKRRDILIGCIIVCMGVLCGCGGGTITYKVTTLGGKDINDPELPVKDFYPVEITLNKGSVRTVIGSDFSGSVRLKNYGSFPISESSQDTFKVYVPDSAIPWGADTLPFVFLQVKMTPTEMTGFVTGPWVPSNPRDAPVPFRAVVKK